MSELIDHESDDSPTRPGAFARLTRNVRRGVFALVILFLLYNMLVHGSQGTPFGKQPGEIQKFGETKKPQPEPEAQPEPEELATPEEPETHPEPQVTEKTTETTIIKQPAPQAAEERPAAPSPQDTQRMEELERKLAEQEARLAAVTAQMEGLLNMRGELETTVGAQQQRLASLTLMGQLRDALARGESFRPIVEELRDLHHQNAKISTLLVQLSGAASAGVETLPALQQNFPPLIVAVLEQQAGGGFAANLKKLVRIRRVGEKQPGMDDESILARAEAQLAQGRLEDTLKTLNAISQPSRSILAPWLKSARDHVTAHDAANELQRLLIAPARETAPEQAAEAAPQPEAAKPEETQPAPDAAKAEEEKPAADKPEAAAAAPVTPEAE